MTKKRKRDNQPPAVQADTKKLHDDDGSTGTTTAAHNHHHTSHDGSPDNLPPLPPISTKLTKAVFTHSSIISNKDIMKQSANYERLEFLGDAYIEVMATRLIWDRYADLPAGRLSQVRELLVKNETLSEIAVKYGLDKQLNAAPHVKTNSKAWTKVKGDLVEAYVAAIVLAGSEVGGVGFAAAEKWLHQLWTLQLEGLPEEKTPDLNAKTALSQKVSMRGVKLEYLEQRVMKQLKGGQQRYYIGAFLTGWGYKKQLLGSGQGLSKTGAGNLAAEDALQNPLVHQIAEMKREFCETIRLRTGDRDDDNSLVDGEAKDGSLPQRRELVEKKRSKFMSSEFG